MGRCSYSWEEWNKEKHENVKKRCQELNWEGSDEFCIFHDSSPEKDASLFRRLIEEKIRIETERLNFIGYYFPEKCDIFVGKKFEVSAIFWGATFQGTANFGGATFQDADFKGAAFQNVYFRGAAFQNVYFRGATFQKAYFERATFQHADFGEATFQDAYFWGVTFQDADFEGATFQGMANFRKATFQGTANFGEATFLNVYFGEATFQNAYFGRATFQHADFGRATFQNAYFWGATFQHADFGRATFQDADFGEATFQNVYFGEATFQDADFERATFQGMADFRKATFQGTANFGGATFEKKLEFAPDRVKRIDFRRAELLFRSKVTANLEEALYQGSFLENVAFVDCTWPEGHVIYEERHMNDKDIDLSFSQLETIYRDLKQNMQRHGDYSTAGDFYYREMECRKWKNKERGPSLRELKSHGYSVLRYVLRRREKPEKSLLNWLRSFGFSFLKYTCGYGEKPIRVIAVAAIIVVVVAFLFQFGGIVIGEYTPEEKIIDYDIHLAFPTENGVEDYFQCLYYSFVTFTTLGYGDIHPIGYSKAFACAEAFTGAFFIALFVLVFGRKMMR